ncbi:hypothetical protein ACOSP7_012187 [Xanthoceras sorbifolium]
MSLEKDTSKIEIFDDINFGFWKMQIEDHLFHKDLYLPLKGIKPEKMTDSDWQVLDRKALGTIRLTLSKSVAFNFKNETTTVSLMTAISSMYEQPSAANKVYLIKTLFNLKMTE